jgi:hypothetical protein
MVTCRDMVMKRKLSGKICPPHPVLHRMLFYDLRALTFFELDWK